MKTINLTVTNNTHFWIKKYRITSGSFEIEIYEKRCIVHIFKIVLIINNLAIFKRICYALFSSTNWKMLFHVALIFRKKIDNNGISNNPIAYSFFTLVKSTYGTSINCVYLISKVANDRLIFIKTRSIYDINRIKI